MKIDENLQYNIVMWGCGYQGRLLYEELNKIDNINIVGVGDKKAKELNNNSGFLNHIYVMSIEEVLDYYNKNLIDGVIIGVLNEYEVVKEWLLEQGVEILEWDKYMISARDCMKCMFHASFDGFDVYELNELHVKIDFDYDSLGFSWQYIENNKYLQESANNPQWLIEHRSIQPLITQSNKRFDNTICVLTRLWSRNYWHFLYEIFDKILMLEDGGYNGKYLLFNSPPALELMKVLKVKDDRIVWIDESCNRDCYVIARALIPQISEQRNDITIERLIRFGDDVIKSFVEDKKYPEIIYLNRIGRRKCLNGIGFAKDNNIFVFTPEDYPLLEQAKFFYFAKIIICPHGAGTANSLFMRRGSCIIELFGADWVNPLCCKAMLKKGVVYQMLVERQILIDEKKHYQDSCYTFNPGDFLIDNELLNMALDNAKKLLKREW